MLVDSFKVDSPAVEYGESHIASTYDYQHTEVDRTEDGKWVVKPQTTRYEFRTDTKVPKLG
jgi:myo-inositol-1-phosphate synthase